jgi:nucleoside-diphosphate-sugar epimerase
MSDTRKILVIGAGGQIGTELVPALRKLFGNENVIASDLRDEAPEALQAGPYEKHNVMDAPGLKAIVEKYSIDTIYLMAALLSATGEQRPKEAWDLNMLGLFHVLDLAKEKNIKVFWPSSIAVFGPTTPRQNTPQLAVCEPGTVYGISKSAGERWCEYYHKRWGVDVRSLRYPGLIGHRSAPGGGTTDYAVHIFYEALDKGHYTCFLEENTRLPMMYMDDAIKATIAITEAPSEQIPYRGGYNLAGFSFTPKELADLIRQHLPNFSIDYAPDFRQAVAASWPESIDDSVARKDWNWAPDWTLEAMVKEMLHEIALKPGKNATIS